MLAYKYLGEHVRELSFFGNFTRSYLLHLLDMAAIILFLAAYRVLILFPCRSVKVLATFIDLIQ